MMRFRSAFQFLLLFWMLLCNHGRMPGCICKVVIPTSVRLHPAYLFQICQLSRTALVELSIDQALSRNQHVSVPLPSEAGYDLPDGRGSR